jgi:hypothetical protein
VDKTQLIVAAVPPVLVPPLWASVEPILAMAVDKAHGDLDIDNLYDRLLAGQEMLLAVLDGPLVIAACIVTVSTLDTGVRVLYVPALAGNRMDEWFEQGLSVLRHLAKEQGCTSIRACGRPGWQKQIPSARAIHTIVEFSGESNG